MDLQHGQHSSCLGDVVQVMIAACDTFRAGAVEQLRTHAQRLQVPLYERGYEKDAAKVAYEACRQAERDGCDVLLVDTAGKADELQLDVACRINSPQSGRAVM